MSAALSFDPHVLPGARHAFEAALPRIDAAIRYHFRRRRGTADHRAEVLAEARAATWVTWHGLVRRGKDPEVVGVAAIVGFVCRGVKNGRTVGANRTQGRGAGDLHHPRARPATGFRVVGFDDLVRQPGQTWENWLAANDRQFTPADEAAIRIDFAAWLQTLPGRKRRAAHLLARGMTTGEVARQLQVTPAAISQDRRWLEKSWNDFQAQFHHIE